MPEVVDKTEAIESAQAAEASAIVTRGLTKKYGSLTALDNLDLTLEKGDVFGFIGPNGAGKSTTMKILAGLLQPTSGQAMVMGRDVTTNGDFVRKNVGYMPDFFGVYEDLTVFEYLEFFASAYGLARKDRKKVVNDVLELTDLKYKQEAMVDSLSRGMQQRLGLARVLVHDPPILLLDEPASGLDPRARIEIRELLRELQRLGKTILVSSHILSELGEFCNKLGIISGVTGSGDKRKLHDRLIAEAIESNPKGSALPLSITLQMEAGGLSAFLIKFSPLQGLYRKLVQAWPEMTVAKFLGISAGISFSFFAICMVGIGVPIIALAAAVFGALIPFFVLGNRRAKRQTTIALQIPEALDFLSRVLKAGHSFSTGIQMMSEELPSPLKDEFRRCYDQHSLGQPLEDALKDMAHRIESTDFAFFITAVLIQRQTGGDLSEVLKNISSMIRQRIRLQQSVKAKTAEGRFTGYILVAFPAVMFFIVSFMNPDYARNLTGTSVGQKMLAAAVFLQIMGLYAIRKITTVKV